MRSLACLCRCRRRGLTSRIMAQVFWCSRRSLLLVGEGWHHASWRRVFGAATEVSCLSERADITHHGAGFLVQPPKSPACRRGLAPCIMAQVFGAAAEVSCLSERADFTHHGEIRLFGQRTKNRDKDDCQDECQTEFGTECSA